MAAEIALPGDPRVRRSGIGGSDIAAIMGVSKWQTAMGTWLDKTGQAAPLIETERMHWGNVLEDIVAREFTLRTGQKLRMAPAKIDPVTGLRARLVRQSEDKPWRMANVDRLHSRGRRGFEAKTADRFAASEFGEPGSDQVPAEYLLQCMWYMAVLDYEVWDLAVLIGGNHFKPFVIERDDELIDQIYTVVDDFWLRNVVGREPPEVDGSEASRKFLEAKMGNEAVEITMTDRMYELALDYESTIREIKDLEARKDALGNGIRDLMPGPGKAARDNAKVSWSMVKATRLDTKALTEAHPSVVKPFMVTSESPRLTVSVKELS